MDEKMLLDTVRQIVREENLPIATRLDSLENEMSGVKSEVSSLKGEIHEIHVRLDFVADVVEETLHMQDGLEQRVRILEEKAV